jgi:hypothetical protein
MSRRTRKQKQNGGTLASKKLRIKNHKSHRLYHAKRNIQQGKLIIQPTTLKNMYAQKFKINNALANLFARTNTRVNGRSSVGTAKKAKHHPLTPSASLLRKYKTPASVRHTSKKHTIAATRKSNRSKKDTYFYNPQEQQILEEIQQLTIREAQATTAAAKQVVRQRIDELSDILAGL